MESSYCPNCIFGSVRWNDSLANFGHLSLWQWCCKALLALKREFLPIDLLRFLLGRFLKINFVGVNAWLWVLVLFRFATVPVAAELLPKAGGGIAARNNALGHPLAQTRRRLLLAQTSTR